MNVSEAAIRDFSKQAFAVAAVFALVIAGVASVTGGSASAARVKVADHQPATGYGAPDNPHPVLRGHNRVNGDHFYTIAPNEHASAKSQGGYSDEGQAFHAYDKPVKGSQPVYRSLNPANGDHFYTANFGEYAKTIKANFQVEGVAFYAYTDPAQATQETEVAEVLRSISKKTGEHLYTVNDGEHARAAEVNGAGYKPEGVAFYTPVPATER